MAPELRNKILDPINQRETLRAFNTQGVHMKWKTESDGHTFSGKLD